MQKSPTPVERLVGFVEQVEHGDGELMLVRVDAIQQERATTSAFSDLVTGEEFLSRMIEIHASSALIRATFDGEPAEDTWIELEIGERGLAALEYRGPLGQVPEPSAIFITAVRKLVPNVEADIMKAHAIPPDAAALSALHKWESSFRLTKRRRETRRRAVDVLDVGQGSCNRIFGDNWQIYFDVGGGCYRNAKTYPNPKNLNFASASLIVLSHWDSDHWYTARVTPNASGATWLVPRQAMGPTAVKFADSVARAGQLIVWPDKLRALYFGLGRVIKCTGTSRNDSGLAIDLLLGRSAKGRARRLLLPGDARYNAIPAQRTNWSGLVASHHGSRSVGLAPRCAADGRIAYSFGRSNTYEHPSELQTHSDMLQGWDLYAETLNGSVMFCPRDKALCPYYLIRDILGSEPGCADGWRARSHLEAMADRQVDAKPKTLPPCVLECQSTSDCCELSAVDRLTG